MKTTFIALLLLAISFSGCQEQPEQSDKNGQSKSEENASGFDDTQKSVQKENKNGTGFWEKLEMRQFYDNQGRIEVEMPFPTTWNVNRNPPDGGASITGPHGVRIKVYKNHSFKYTDDPRMQQVYYHSGQQLRSMPGIEKIIEEDLVPVCNEQGLKFIRWYEVPEVSKADKWLNDQLYKPIPSQMDLKAIGTEWETKDGKPYLLLMHLTSSYTPDLHLWGYQCAGLEADAEHFEKSKKIYLFSLANAHYNLEPIMEYNQMEAQKAGQSWAAFNQRMARNQAAFEAHQRNHVNRTNAINDAIMNGWNERNAASDKSHEGFIDAITERTNVIDPNSGQKYKVSAGSNQYWMNSNGEYIGTEKPGYDPNLDENMNEVKWQELNEVK